MHFVLYDRFLNTIGNSYILESWSRTQRAVDFDDLRIIGEQIEVSSNPFLVVLNDKQGNQMFSGLASTPIIDEKTKKTTIVLKDYMTLFNTEIIMDWGSISDVTTVGDYIDRILTRWKAQSDIGIEHIVWDISDVANLPLDKDIPLGEARENVRVKSLIFDALNYYKLYCESEINIYTKTLIYTFKRSFFNKQAIRLNDFGVDTIDKSFGECNRASVFTSSFALQSQWALTEDNSVVKLPSEKDLVYPGKNKNFIASGESEDDLYDAIYDAVMELSSNRYQENIDINVVPYKSVLDLSTVDFSYSIEVHTSQGYYKELPVGEIETDSSGKHIVRLGYRIQELTQEI